MKKDLVHIGKFGKPVILSTGMANMGEIETALDVLETSGTPRNQITVLHCNTAYPTPLEDVNLRAMLAIRDVFGVSVGYSDHTLGIEVPIAAVALGAMTLKAALGVMTSQENLMPDLMILVALVEMT